MSQPPRRGACMVCAKTYAVNRDGRLRAHDITPGKRCRGSGAKVAKTWKPARRSVRSVSGGLPSLGKNNPR